MSGNAEPQTLLGAHAAEEIDIHGLTADEAAARVRAFLHTCARSASGQAVRIVTGKGNRSAGPPVLLPLVRRLLETELAAYVQEFTVDMGGGSYMVRMR